MPPKVERRKKNAPLSFFATLAHQPTTSKIAALTFVPKLGHHDVFVVCSDEFPTPIQPIPVLIKTKRRKEHEQVPRSYS
jgi:hypothetical protein